MHFKFILFAATIVAATATESATDVPETAAPLIEGESPLKWLGIGICSFIVMLLLLIICLIARKGSRESVGDLFTRLLMVCPPSSYSEARRLISSDLRNIESTKMENEILSARNASLRALPTSLLCWRRTHLGTSLILYLVALGLSISASHSQPSFKLDVIGDDTLSDETVLRKHFRDQLLGLIPFAQSVLSVLFYGSAVFCWSDLNQSRLFAVTGFTITFMFPFVVFMVPWMEIDDPQRMVQDMCRFIGSNIPILTKGGLELAKTSICERTADKIGDAFENSLVINNIENGELLILLMGMVLKYLVYVPTVIASFVMLKSLAPGVLGILMGLQGGLSLSKLSFPGSRLTTWLLVLIQTAAIPVTMFLCAIILIVVGTYPTMFTAIFMTISVSLFVIFHKRLIKAVTLETASKLVGRINAASIGLKIIAVGCLVLGVYYASHIMALKSQGVEAVKNALTPLSVSRMAVSFLAGYFSSKVVFTDIVLHIIISTYVECVVADSKEDRIEVMRDILFLSTALKEFEHKFELKPVTSGDVRTIMGQAVVDLSGVQEETEAVTVSEVQCHETVSVEDRMHETEMKSIASSDHDPSTPPIP